MQRKVLPLYEICLEEIAQLLKNSYWEINVLLQENPFIFLPSSMIDSLIVSVTRLSVSEPLQCSDLYLLLTSGRVREFILEDVNLDSETLENIFMFLSGSCQNLISIKLKNVFSNIAHRTNAHQKTKSLNCLLSLALNLKCVESCIEFNLSELRKCVFLEKLVLNFPVNDHVYEFIDIFGSNGQIKGCNSLKHLEIYEDVRHTVSHIEVGVVLGCCPELVDINCDISKGLEYLHAKSLYNGTLNTKYKLQKCNLGSIYLSGQNAAVSRDGVYIASLTCPDLRDLSVLVNDNSAVCALSDFKNLSSLLLQWEALQGGDFTFGVQILLEKPELGQHLICLHIIHFSNIDFSSIGICCPNLEILRVEYASENNQKAFLPTLFQKLHNLHLENIDDLDCCETTLVGILSNATNLKYLTIQPAGNLRDQVLAEVLEKNSLSKLKEIRFSNCVLSFHGIRNLATSLTALEYLELSTSEINLDEAAAVIHEINPHVILSSTAEG